MPLKLEMKMGDRIIINGAVVEVVTPHAKLIVHNQAAILRGKEIIAEEHAITPATRVYFALQSAYLFPDHAEEYLSQYDEFIDQYLTACPSAADIVAEVKEAVEGGQLYKGLKKAQKLVLHQQGVLQEFEEQLVQLAEEAEEDEDEDASTGSIDAPGEKAGQDSNSG